VAILQTVFLAGDVWAVIVPNGLALLAMAALFLGLICGEKLGMPSGVARS